MWQIMINVITVLTPICVAAITVVGSIIIAKINKVHSDMKTNHGSKNLGDAVDKITESLNRIKHKQDGLSNDVGNIQNDLDKQRGKLSAIAKKTNTMTEPISTIREEDHNGNSN